MPARASASIFSGVLVAGPTVQMILALLATGHTIARVSLSVKVTAKRKMRNEHL